MLRNTLQYTQKLVFLQTSASTRAIGPARDDERRSTELPLVEAGRSRVRGSSHSAMGCPMAGQQLTNGMLAVTPRARGSKRVHRRDEDPQESACEEEFFHGTSDRVWDACVDELSRGDAPRAAEKALWEALFAVRAGTQRMAHDANRASGLERLARSMRTPVECCREYGDCERGRTRATLGIGEKAHRAHTTGGVR